MPDYTIYFTRSARKELEALDGTIVRLIFPRIRSLGAEPRPSGCRKLQGDDRLWRIRIGDYRVVYRISDQNEQVDIISVRHRRDAYR
jgi:mRNA interferase RelE/StbE